MARITIPAIHVVLDTNALFTDRADKLLQADLSQFIKQDWKAAGVNLTWHLPTVVMAERRRQMLEVGLKLLVPLQKLEKLLGHSFAMGADILADRVDAAIRNQLEEYSLTELKLDIDKVNWGGLIDCAITGEAPFSDTGDKGFKDAIILESFLQLVERLPNSARVLIITKDSRLAEAIERRTAANPNVKVFPDIGALRTLLNAVASHVPQEEVDKIISMATPLFFLKERKTGLYYKANIHEKIDADAQFKPPPEPGFMVAVQKVVIYTPSFIKKEGQQITFETEIEYLGPVLGCLPTSTT